MFTTLISTDQLATNLDNSNWIIFDCRASLFDHDAGRNAYIKGHIPNALFCDLENDLSSKITEQSGRHPLPDIDTFVKRLENWGVSNQSQVVVYDDAGGSLAVRLWWLLRTLGHTQVAVLNGGIPQWIKEGNNIESGFHESSISTQKINTEFNLSNFKISNDLNSDISSIKAWLSTKQVEHNLTSKSFTLLDARTPERYRGESEPIDTIAGRIPNSLNHAFQLNLDENGMFLSPDHLREKYNEIISNTPHKSADKIVHLCGSGVTACHNMLAMEIAGLKGSRLYAGSWSEWIRDSQRPVDIG